MYHWYIEASAAVFVTKRFSLHEADEMCLPHLPKDISEAAQEVGNSGPWCWSTNLLPTDESLPTEFWLRHLDILG